MRRLCKTGCGTELYRNRNQDRSKFEVRLVAEVEGRFRKFAADMGG